MAMNNSLAEVHPELVSEWSEKNLPLTPDDITFGSNKKVWWRGACGHEWQTSVKARSNGEKCPICSGARVIAGINDLATLEPLLVKQWSKKNKIKPTGVSIVSHKKVIWRCEKHFMDIMNGSYAQTHFPCKLWDAGEKGLTLSAFEWEKDRKTLIYGQVDYMYGEALYKPEMKEGNPIRLYSLDEITEIFGKLGLRICNSFADFSGKPSSDNDIQLMVYSIRE